MELLANRYTGADGWSTPLPGHLNSPHTLVLAFAAPEFGDDPRPFDELSAAFPQSVIAGCSTSGEIAGTTVSDGSISVAIARFEHTAIRRAFTAVGDAADSSAAGIRLAEQLAGDDLRAVFVLSDGLHVNGTPLVESLTRHLPPKVVIAGGLAGDGGRFKRTWILERGRPSNQGICAIGFYGARLHIGHGCEGGWSDFGPERLITRSNGNVLYELDGKPALELYKTYLGERAQGLPGTGLLFPLAVRRVGQTQGDPVVRTILAIDEAQQSLTFAGDMPQGAVARLMRANIDKLIDSAGKAASAAARDAPDGQDALVISVSCVGRRLVLGERTEEEVEIVDDCAPRHGVHIGFYSYGEISPSLPGAVSDLHNQTMTVTVLSEV
jgi:hypothetical protein